MSHNPGFKYTSAEAAKKMIDEISKDPGAWADGAARTPVDVIAAASSDVAEKNFAAAMSAVIAQKLRQAGLKKVTTADWKRIIASLSGSWSSGVSADADKIMAAVANAVEQTYAAADEARKMPKGLPGSGENKARMTKYFDSRVARKKASGT